MGLAGIATTEAETRRTVAMPMMNFMVTVERGWIDGSGGKANERMECVILLGSIKKMRSEYLYNPKN